ncbi:MAG: alpha-amylase family glycosyl hydrolase, partial [Clostridia bacterium]
YFNRSGKWGDGGAYNDQSSPYYDWYKFTDWNNKKYQSWWDFDTLPVLNPRSSSLQEYFAGKKGIVAKWLRLGARGWRLDVVDEIADCMLDKIVYRAKNVKRDSVILGEVWEDASNKKDYGVRRRYFLGRQLDSVMNYPMRTAILNFVATGNNSLFNSTVFMILNNYPKEVRDNLMNMLSTHDTERALTFLGGKVSSDKNVMANLTMSNEEKKRALVLFRLASVLQYTVFGFPCVFYGDEAEMQGGKDPFCRGCYPWGNENTELLSFFKNLGGVRKEKVLYSGEFKLLGAPPNVVAFERTSSDETLQVMANRGDDYEFYLPCNYVELISGETYSGNCILRRDSAVILKRVTI